MNRIFFALIGVILCSAVQCMDVPCRNGDGQLVSLEMCSGVGYCANNGTHCNTQAQQTSLLIGNDLTKFTASLEEDNDTLDARLFPIGGASFGGQSITPPVPYGNGQLPTNIPSSLPGGLPPLPEMDGLFPGTGVSPPGLGNVGGLPPGLGLPGSLIPGSVGTVFPNNCQNSFPSICGISTYSTNILQLLDAPVNIPYCRRIPCSTSNPMLETDRFACHAVPGCYFDLELANLRRMYPNSVLPGVPVCHLAIRNRKFQYLANQYMQGRGRWNGIYNKCFIEQNKNEIYSPDAGCYVISVLKYMGIQRKLAGWDGITTEECYLIDGCPVDGGCFHPGQLNQIQVRSGEDETRNSFNSGMNYYGQPKCMEYNPTTSDELLQGYHQCRQAGCVVDPQINSDVLKYNLYRVARTLPANKQAKFWGEVIQNRITPDNYQQFLNKIEQRCALPGNGIKGYNNLLAYSLTLGVLGSGASVPRSVLPNNPMFQPQCPYQNFGAGLTSLRGKFTGCCERNLCYIPRTSILTQQSGVASYNAQWGEYTPCTARCGGGTRFRRRKCVQFKPGDLNCDVNKQTERCNVEACPYFGTWSEYGQCSASCGGGTQTRSRQCLPAGSTCENDDQGGETQSKACNNIACPVYSGWTGWSPCNAVCGLGERIRERTCTAQVGGAPCDLQVLRDTKQCEISCGACEERRERCLPHPNCYRDVVKECVPDAAGGAHCPDCRTPVARKERCAPQGGPLVCIYCAQYGTLCNLLNPV